MIQLSLLGGFVLGFCVGWFGIMAYHIIAKMREE